MEHAWKGVPQIDLPPLCTYKDLKDSSSGIHIEDLGMYQISIYHRVKEIKQYGR